MLALVADGSGSSRRRRRSRGPWIALAGALAVYIALLVLPWRLHPRRGTATLVVSRVGKDGGLEPLAELAPVLLGTPVAFTVGAEREGSVVVVALTSPEGSVVVAPERLPALRLSAGGTETLPERPRLAGRPATERFVAVVCSTTQPPDVVQKAAERALLTAGGDPEAVQTVGLGCAEAFATVSKRAPP